LDQPPFDAITSVTVTGGSNSPSTDLLAGWLAGRLRVNAVREQSAPGSGLLRVQLHRTSGTLELSRPLRSTVATLSHPLQPKRRIAMARRSDAECLADELRHLDADEIYEAALRRGRERVRTRRAA
jgi:glucose-6-phosphate dehydrogenase assembly protein OpcA